MEDMDSTMVDGYGIKSDVTYPAVVIQKKSPMSYFFHIPHDTRLGYRFHAKEKSLYLNCTSCAKIHMRRYRLNKNDIANLMSRKFSGRSMLEDPSLNHLQGCEPEAYSEVLKNYRACKDEHMEPSSFPLELLQKKEYAVLVRLPVVTDVEKCYKFIKTQTTKGHFYVACSMCNNTARKECRRSMQGMKWIRGRRCTIDGFSEDPTLQHHAHCVPLLYSDVMKDYEIVDKETAVEYLPNRHVLSETDDDDSMPVLKRPYQHPEGTGSLYCTNRNVLAETDSMPLLEIPCQHPEGTGSLYCKSASDDDDIGDTIATPKRSRCQQLHSVSREDKELAAHTQFVNRVPDYIADLSSARAQTAGPTDNIKRETEADVDDSMHQVKVERPSPEPDSTDVKFSAGNGGYQEHTFTFGACGFTKDDDMTVSFVEQFVVVKFKKIVPSTLGGGLNNYIEHNIGACVPRWFIHESVKVDVRDNQVLISVRSPKIN